MGTTLAEVGIEMGKAAGAAVIVGGTWKLGNWAWNKIFGNSEPTVDDIRKAIKDGVSEAIEASKA